MIIPDVLLLSRIVTALKRPIVCYPGKSQDKVELEIAILRNLETGTPVHRNSPSGEHWQHLQKLLNRIWFLTFRGQVFKISTFTSYFCFLFLNLLQKKKKQKQNQE